MKPLGQRLPRGRRPVAAGRSVGRVQNRSAAFDLAASIFDLNRSTANARLGQRLRLGVIAAECEVPAAPVHGSLLDGARQEPRDSFPAGATVSFKCEEDYRLVGSRSITCQKGEWSDDPPVCRGMIALFCAPNISFESGISL